jgi:Ca-activated chloride channel homolog
MNNQSFERQMQQVEAPQPDPEARLRARQAAVEEFARVHVPKAPQPTRTQRVPTFWLGGFATACVAIVGVSIMWLMPASDRVVAPQMAVRTESESLAAPAEVEAFTAEEKAPPAGASTDVAESRAKAAARTQVPAVMLDIPPPPPAGAGASANGSDAARGNVLQQPRAELREPLPAVIIAEVTTQPVPPAPPAPLPPRAAPSQSSGQDVLKEAQVSGTRVRPANQTANTPVITITAEEMRRLGIVNVADAQAALVPQNIVSTTPTAAGASLLTLVDGRRMLLPAPAPSGDAFAQFAVNPVKRTADEPVSTFSADVDTASYSFVRRQLNAGVLPPPDAVRTEEMINYFDYAWPAATSRNQPFRPTVTVSDSPWNKDRKLVHIGIKGYQLPASQRPDVNLVLLLDVSGSMNSPDKLPLAQRSMALLLDSLKPTDTVGIAVYAGAAGEVLPPTPVREKDTILRALYSLQPGGSTAGAAGIQLAYEMAARNLRKEGVNRILLATDGDFNVGIRDAGQLKAFVQRQRDNGVFLSVLGFGQGNYRDETAQTLAQNGNGVAAYIDTLDEARKVLVEQASAQLFTIAKDVKLQVEFNPDTVTEYRLVGYETRALNREDFNNDRVDAGDVGAGHTVTAIYEITPVGTRGLVDERRYGTDSRVATPRGRARADEYGYLKIRYKLPGEDESKLLEQPIAVKAGVPAGLRQEVRFATAVAGFAQLLQGGQYTGSLNFDDVMEEAESNLGRDTNRYRTEFLKMVREAKSLRR